MRSNVCVLILALSLATACTPAAWQQDPDIQAARETCGGLPDAEQYDCFERQAVEQSNPEICRLAGEFVDDACLQAVYEAADDAIICERIYLQGVVPNCRAYYAHLATEAPTDTHSPTEATPTGAVMQAASLIPGLELGYDCSKVERLHPDSPEAQRMIQEFVENFKAQWPTEYMAMETTWSVDRLGEYAIILGAVTSDERDAIVVQQTPQGYRMVSRFIVTWGVSSRYTIPEYFAEQLPEAPMELFYCMDVGRLVENLPAQELDLNREYDCSILEAIPVDSPEGQVISQILLDFQKGSSPDSLIELDEVRSIARLEPYLAAQARFRQEGRPEPPVLFLLEDSAGSYKVIGYFTGPTLTRKNFLREIYAEVYDVPQELLACLELDWFFPQSTPTPSMATSELRERIGGSLKEW